jgi:hypothetical protein
MIATKQCPLCAIILTALLLGTGWGSSAVVAQQRIGVSSAVNPEATGISPGAPARRLVLGQEIVFNEQIRTGATGQTQILFVDGSAMTIGPDSFMVIDQFSYDPNSGGGTLKIDLERGQVRFVGGKLSKQDSPVTMKTPSAVIELRGGVILVDLSPNGKLNVIFAYGKGVAVTGLNGISQTITRPGFQISLSGRGAAPSTPFPASPGASAAILARLDGQRGGTGGATTVPTDEPVASSRATELTSSNVSAQGTETAQVSASSGQTSSAQGSTAAGQTSSAAASGPVQQIQTNLQAAANQPTSASPSTYAGIFKSTTNGNGSIIGFTGQSPPARIPYTDGKLVNGFFTSALGGAGTLTIPLAPGTATFGPSGTASPLGPVNGTSYLSADGTFFYANLTPVNAPMQTEFIAGGIPVKANSLASAPIVAFKVQQDAALQSGIPFIPANALGNLTKAYVSPLYIAPQSTTVLQTSLAINGQGTNQKSVLVTAIGSMLPNSGKPLISGVVRGSSQSLANTMPIRIGSNLSSIADGNGNSLYGSTGISGFVLDQTTTSLASEVPLTGAASNYGFNQPATATSLPLGVGTSRTPQSLTGYFGGLMNTTAQTQPYSITGTTALKTDAVGNRVTATFTSDSTLSVTATGGVSSIQFGGTSNSVFIDDNIYGAAESQTSQTQVNGSPAQSSQLYLLSQGAAPPPSSLLPSGVSYCQCQYLQWGYWGGDITSTSNGASRIDRGGINFWVAGQITPIADINMLAAQGAIGNYSGHLIGSVYNNGAQYVAAGGLTATYNFGTQAASFSVNNYDNLSFTTKGTPNTSGATYKFPINDVSNLTGTINGSFYGPLAAETGGNFTFSKMGVPYRTSGIFAAVKR